MAQYGFRTEDIIIPAQDLLYRRIPKKTYWDIITKYNYSPEIIPPKIFSSNEEEYSVDWERYAIPLWTQTRMDEFIREENGIENYGINHYGVMSILTGGVREIPLEVVYSPKEENPAHSDIKMPISTIDITEMREMLSYISKIEIQPPPLEE